MASANNTGADAERKGNKDIIMPDLRALWEEMSNLPDVEMSLAPDEYTVARVMKETGFGRDRSQRFIRKAIAAGRCKFVRKQVICRANGTVAPHVPVYRFIPPKPEGKDG